MSATKAAAIVALMAMFGIERGTAQDSGAKPPLPAGPLVAKEAPKFAAWSVTTSYVTPAAEDPEGSAATEDLLKTVVTYTKTDDICKEEVRLADGKQLEIWHSPGFVVVDAGKPEQAVSSSQGRQPVGGFTGFEWLSPQNFSSIEKGQDGRKYLKFVGKASILSQAQWEGAPYDGPPPQLDAVALVDLESRLPIALRIGNETRKYQFGDAPTAHLQLPAAVKEAIKAKEDKIQAAQLKPPRP